jgi:hypothetical protein
MGGAGQPTPSSQSPGGEGKKVSRVHITALCVCVCVFPTGAPHCGKGEG